MKTAKKTAKLMSGGVEIGENVFHLVGFSPDGELVLRKKDQAPST